MSFPRRHPFRLPLIAAALSLAATQLCPAQVLYGTLVGTVTDASGALVPNAQVHIVSSATGDTRTATTNDAGIYTLPSIPPGAYTVSISAQGFSDYQATGVIVNPNNAVRIDATLKTGGSNETVEVNTTTAALQTDRADVHQEVTSEQLQSLPQPTRTYQGLLALVPGVAPPSANNGGTNNPMRSMVISANGTSASGTNVRIDGVSATNPWVQFYTTAVPSSDAIQTVNVVTSTSGADQGMANGAAVNVQLRSGTNKFHGSAYLYHLDNLMKARPYFLPKTSRLPKYIDNNPGGTIGGPILHDRLFFFGSYEGDFLHQGNINIATVPTAAMRAGDFSGSASPIYDPATGDASGAGRAAFAGKVIPGSRFNPIAQKLIALIPQPNLGSGISNNYYVNTPSYYKLQKIDTKLDWNASSKLHIFGRFSDYPYGKTQGTVFGPILGGSNAAEESGNVYAFSVSATYIVTPHLVLDGVFGLTHSRQQLSPPNSSTRYGSDVLGIPGTNLGDLPSGGSIPQFNVSNFSNYGYDYPALIYNDPIFQYTGNATWTKGKHNVRFGMEVSRQHMNHSEVQPTGFSFTGGATALNGGSAPNQYNSFADFVLGLPYTAANSLQTVPNVTLRTWILNPYIGDTWQIHPRITLAVGSGWEYYPVPTREDRGIEFFDLDTKQYKICGKGTNPVDCGIHVQKTLFSPRGGIAVRLTDQDVLRAGYSLNPEQINMVRDGLYSYPTEITTSYSGPNSYTPYRSLSLGIPTITPPDISSGVIPLPAGVTFTTSPKNFVRGYVQSYNMTFERDFGHQWLGSVGYVGSHTVHQHTRYNINYGLPGGGAASQPFNNGTLGTGSTGSEVVIYPYERMNYNSLQATLQHRLSNGSQIQVAYTWSKWLGICCDANADGGPAIPIPQYYRLNYARMPGDRTNNLRISGTAVLPFGKNQMFLSDNGLVSTILGGWQINGIVSFYSGSPFSPSASGASLNAPGSTQRADQLKEQVAIYGSPAKYFDTSAFAPVTTARFGTAGFNSLRGPGYSGADLSIFRTFALFENLTMQGRLEALNVTNTPHFSNPNGNVSSAAFGTITSTSPGSRTTDERYFRLGVKFAF
ncbi:TonB-dependent receptor family protein [Terriglobus roseus DSM 18391]|uniref:TonB-dependent receptor family protein n=1 Tax=Terriglobus roseus (strain DSM 18391 / NRRL B-41598 / KBS 63) TaxID=926566 RepID=I3ZIU2_TERRK|nr:carboxypeptidase regulatory-like domain-containing protein [Terriglobus roseus]AFL89160.1 TonB-dependent receptor family protein [Terriglobus roseus DSM 18391]